ncbi:hypothetical protein C8J57DRAFT_1260116 [Mycena rebaudengoi]|nr:hypothetical protein C8J57DRAFT_1260116 [Mycena rebaudengoi]
MNQLWPMGNLAANCELRDEVVATIPAAVVVGRGGWWWLHNAGGTTGRSVRLWCQYLAESLMFKLRPTFGRCCRRCGEHLGIERTGVIEARRRSGVHGGNGGIKVMASGV